MISQYSYLHYILIYYVFVLVGVDPDKNHVHHPNPSHVELIVSDFDAWIVWISQCSLLAKF